MSLGLFRASVSAALPAAYEDSMVHGVKPPEQKPRAFRFQPVNTKSVAGCATNVSSKKISTTSTLQVCPAAQLILFEFVVTLPLVGTSISTLHAVSVTMASKISIGKYFMITTLKV